MLMRNTYVFLAFLLAFLPVSAQQRYYVAENAAGQNTGVSWADAFRNLHDALALSLPGDEIWVAEGTYRPSESGDRFVRFELASGVRLYGGFAGSEMLLEERTDPDAHRSALSGDIGIQGDSLDNSYNILYLPYPDSNTVVDGFTFVNGLANSDTAYIGRLGASGAAIYIQGNDSIAYPSIRWCRFVGNAARSFGGAVYVGGGNTGSVAPRFEHCYFEWNRSPSSFGGAVYRGRGSRVERPRDFYECVFKDNRARFGGAVCFSDTEGIDTLDIVNCRFDHNHAIVFGSALLIDQPRTTWSVVSLRGARVENHDISKANSTVDVFQYSITGGSVDLRVDSCSFENNQWSETGAVIAMFYDSPGDYNLTIKKSRLTSINVASYTTKKYKTNFFFQNTNFFKRGYIDSWSKDIWIKECTFENLIEIKGRDLSILGSKVREGMIRYYPGEAVQKKIFTLFTNNCIYQDTLALSQIYSDTVMLYNNIFWRNKYKDTYFSYKGKDQTILSHCLMDVPPSAIPPTALQSNNLFQIAPLFRDTTLDDLRLQPCSPLINAGNNAAALTAGLSIDLDGKPRMQGGAVDIGPYEANPLALSGQPDVKASCPATASGAIQFAVSDGCPPYAVMWASAAGGSGTDLAPLPSGSYTVTVTDARGSAFAFTAAVPTGGTLPWAATALPVVCGDTLGGSVRLHVSGGQPPYTIHWADTPGSDSLRTQLPAGAYTATVTDSKGCTALGQVEVKTSGVLLSSVSAADISCYGATDGSLAVQPINGKPPYTWEWQDGSTLPTLAPLGPGTYQCTLSDALGCSFSWTLPLKGPDSITLSVSMAPASALTTADGSLRVDSIGGGTAPFQIKWSSGHTGPIADGLLPGLYTVSVTDHNGCTKTAVYVVKVASATGEPGESLQLSLWPNPTAGTSWLQIAGGNLPEGQWGLTVYDGQGHLLLQEVPAQLPYALEMKNWPSGAYQVRIEATGSVPITAIVVKQ